MEPLIGFLEELCKEVTHVRRRKRKPKEPELSEEAKRVIIDAIHRESERNLDWAKSRREELRREYGSKCILVYEQKVKYVADKPEPLIELGHRFYDDAFIVMSL